MTTTNTAPAASAWRQRVSGVRETLRRYRAGEAGVDWSRRTAHVYLGLFVPALATLVLANWKWNAVVNDTMLLESSFDMVATFSSMFSNANANPLQALFDIFPSGFRADLIPNVIGRPMFGPGLHVEFFYIFSGVALGYAVAAMARAVELRWSVAVLAGILMPFLSMPIVGVFPLVEHFYILWPITYYSTAGIVLCTALFWRIDGRSWRRTAALTAVVILVLVHLSLVQVVFMTILAPALFAMGAGALASSRSRGEVRAKLASAVVIGGALAATGVFHFLYAFGLNTASHVFYRELMDFMLFSAPNWPLFLGDIRYVIPNPFTYNYYGSATIDGVVVPLSQLGAVYLGVFGRTRALRIFGWTVVIWVLATALLIAVLHTFYYYTGLMYQGPDPRHLTPVMWPYYMICLASILLALAESAARLWARVRARASARVSVRPAHVVVGVVLASPLVFLGTSHVVESVGTFRRHYFERDWPYTDSFRRYPIIDYLESQVAVAIDREFRGSVVAMPTDFHKDIKPYNAWRRETTFSYARAYLGNDLGAFGLRRYNIPTLDEMTHNVTPQFYLTVRELLSRPGIDVFDKHFALVTRLNEPIMALLGLRFIIADYPLPFGTERLAMPFPDEAKALLESQQLWKSPLRVYELANPNLGDYSPTAVKHVETARDAILEMARADFDGRRTLITDDPSIGGALVPARDVTMTVRMGGVALQAASAGQSVLVLPVQFSHCWQITSGSGASLFRANLTQLGVRFRGSLRVELRQIFGPFWQSGCRLDDAADVERLRMADAAGAVADGLKVPGDGFNLITSAEALDTAVGDSQIAAIATDSPANEAKSYTIRAQGAESEHYVAFSVPGLEPGVAYTLSMHVRADSTEHLYLQLVDGANGALASYLLPTRQVFTTVLGSGQKVHASIQEVDEEWLRLTLTSTVAAQPANVIIQLSDRGNRVFEPDDEAVTIRAVMLERGETATPYPGRRGDGRTDAGAAPLMPGDGVNLIATPEALETVIAGNDVASFQPGPPAPVRTYTIRAQGRPGEHYSVLPVATLKPGPLTLSMQVRASGTEHVYLQLMDGANGAIAGYHLPSRTASANPLGKGSGLLATVADAGDGWLQLTLSTTYAGESGYVIIQLADRNGNRSFAPRGESVTIRGLKIERGQTATVYPGTGRAPAVAAP